MSLGSCKPARGSRLAKPSNMCYIPYGMDSDFYRKRKKGIDLRSLWLKLLRNRRLMLLIVVGTPIMLYVVFGPRGVVKRIRLQHQKTQLEEQIRVEETEIQRLQAESKALDGDKAAIEKVAREKYGMVREGETMYKVNRK
jgi:cell division protein FtsB